MDIGKDYIEEWANWDEWTRLKVEITQKAGKHRKTFRAKPGRFRVLSRKWCWLLFLLEQTHTHTYLCLYVRFTVNTTVLMISIQIQMHKQI